MFSGLNGQDAYGGAPPSTCRCTPSALPIKPRFPVFNLGPVRGTVTFQVLRR